VVFKDVSLRGHPQCYALDQHDKARVVLFCRSARTFLFYSEKKKYQKKAPPFAQSLRGQRVSLTLFSFGVIERHGTGLLPMQCCLWTAVRGCSLVWYWCYRINIYDSKRCHHGLGFFSTISSWAVDAVFLGFCRRSGDRVPQ
jgi:hypothetical protein